MFYQSRKISKTHEKVTNIFEKSENEQFNFEKCLKLSNCIR